MNPIVKRVDGQVVRRMIMTGRKIRDFIAGPSPIWMEKLEPRRLMSVELTSINGATRIDFGGEDRPAVVALQDDGKILIASYTGNGGALTRLNADRTLDTTFGDNGVLKIDYDRGMNMNDMDVLDDGSILISGAVYNDAERNHDFSVIKISEDGRVDTTFGKQGLVTLDVTGEQRNDSSFTMMVDSAGRMVLIGSVSSVSEESGIHYEPIIVRLLADGTVDSSFGDNGQVNVNHLTPGQANDYAGARLLAALPEGGLLVQGNVESEVTLLKLTADGSLDTSFGENGIVNLTDLMPEGDLSLRHSGAIAGVGIQSNGRIVVSLQGNLTHIVGLAGNSGRISAGAFKVIRLNTDGSVDDTFSTFAVVHGSVSTPPPGTAVFTAIWSSLPTTSRLRINDDGNIITEYSRMSDDGSGVTGAIATLSADGNLISSRDIQAPAAGSSLSSSQFAGFTSDGDPVVIGVASDSEPDYPPMPENPTEEEHERYMAAQNAWTDTWDIFIAVLDADSQSAAPELPSEGGESDGSADPDAPVTSSFAAPPGGGVFSMTWDRGSLGLFVEDPEDALPGEVTDTGVLESI